jgi:hypothetical protein
MSTLLQAPGSGRIEFDTGSDQTRARPVGGLGFDWAMMALCMVFLGGLFVDGWAHNHDRVDQSFFTPWHAFFYSGFLLVVLLLVGTLLVNHFGLQRLPVWTDRFCLSGSESAGEGRGLPWRDALPAGYELSLLGVLVFAAGGVGDLIWHELFGVEQDFEALFSPSHLALALGLGLVVTGPLRAAWQRPGATLRWHEAGPALLSLAALISTLTFFGMYSHPLVSNIAAADHYEWFSEIGQVAGAISIVLSAAFFTAPVLLVLYRWQLPPGSLLLVWGINIVAMALLNWHHAYTWLLMGVMLVAAGAAEAIRLALSPGPVPLAVRPAALHLFGFLAPVLLLGGYFLAMLAAAGTSWSVHLWTGAVAEAGAAGWLLSYLVAPPAIPEKETTGVGSGE